MDESSSKGPKGFTLIELLVTIAIIAILAAAVVVVLNPLELLAESRDSKRMTDMKAMQSALDVAYYTNPSMGIGTTGVIYTSLSDTSAGCASHTNLPQLPAGTQWNCVTAANLRNVNGTGWVPADVSSIANIPALPVDPTNDDYYFYSYYSGGSSWEFNAPLESQKYFQAARSDGGDDGYLFEWGTSSKLMPYIARRGAISAVIPSTVKVLVVEFQDCGQNVTGQLSRLGFTNVTVATTITTKAEVDAYAPNIVVGSEGCWGISKNALFTELYNAGYAVYTQGNDTSGIYPIATSVSVSSGTASGTITKASGHPINNNWTSTGNSGSDGRRGITALVANGITLANDATLGYKEIIYLEETGKGRWFHTQPSPAPNDTLFRDGFYYLAR